MPNNNHPTQHDHKDDGRGGGTISPQEVLDTDGNRMLAGNVKSGSVQLSSGTATVDTGVSESTTATFMIAIGPDTDDAEVGASIRAVSSGNYQVHIDETADTAVDDPTVNYDIVRVR